jgi:glycosyltransferase involved in cell wall biosynthesis
MEYKIKNPILSIVIPTKNRYEYLKTLIVALLNSKSQEFELIIQDNSDDNSDFLFFINEINDSRLIYGYTSGWLSVIDNCDLGISAAIGDYVCMLGDDDGILIENSIELLKWLSIHQYEASLVNIINYSWPDITHAVWGDSYSGRVDFEPFKYTYRVLSSKKELNRICNEGAAFGLRNLPRVYHAFVSRKKLIELKEETGTYFPGPSPDMANAVGLTKYVNEYVCIDMPTIISGQSRKSTAGQGSMKKHHGSIKHQSHLPKDTAQKWSKQIPFFWSGPTIYAESASKALEMTNRQDMDISYNYLYACCLVYEKEYRKEVFSFISKQESTTKVILNYFKITFIVVGFIRKRLFRFLINLITNKIKFKKHLFKNDIGEAIEWLNATYKKEKIELTEE